MQILTHCYKATRKLLTRYFSLRCKTLNYCYNRSRWLTCCYNRRKRFFDLLLKQNKQNFNLLLHRKMETVEMLLQRRPRTYLERPRSKGICFKFFVWCSIFINCMKCLDGLRVINPSGWGHLNPSSYCDVGRLFYGVFKLWSKLQRKK